LNVHSAMRPPGNHFLGWSSAFRCSCTVRAGATFAPIARFLTSEWIAALDRAGRSSAIPSGMRITIQQVVTGEDGGDVRYHLVMGDGSVRVQPGRAEAPDLTLTQPYEVAAAISRGELNAQHALSEGRLKLAGDIDLLLRNARALTALEDIFAAVRAETTY
jgi:putative sterol carrier protein